jgi:hypothetical protein
VKPLTILFILTGLLAALAILSAFWLWFMIRRPVQWVSISDKMDDFLVRKRIMSNSFAEKCKRFERGFGKKLLIGLVVAALVECAGGVLYAAFVIIRSGILLRR